MDRGGSHTPAALAAIAALIIASGGCFQDKEGPLLPCPSGGISVALVDTGPPPAAPPNCG
jgi:hypothetical protein